MESIEYKTLNQCYPTLVSSLAQSPNDVAIQLRPYEFFAPENLAFLDSRNNGNAKKAQKIVDVVMIRVYHDPQMFNKFIEALKAAGSWTGNAISEVNRMYTSLTATPKKSPWKDEILRQQNPAPVAPTELPEPESTSQTSVPEFVQLPTVPNATAIQASNICAPRTVTEVCDIHLDTEIGYSDFLFLAGCFQMNDPKHLCETLHLLQDDCANVESIFYKDGLQAAVTEALRIWLRTNSMAVTFRDLVNIALKMDNRDLANEVRQYAAHKVSDEGVLSTTSFSVSDNDSASDSDRDHVNLFELVKSKLPLEGRSGEKYVRPTRESTKIMKGKFASLIDKILESIMRKQVNPHRLILFLSQYAALDPVSSTVESSCLLFGSKTIQEYKEQCESISDVLMKLNGYYSWFNYRLIKDIANHFCEDDKEVKEELRKYKKTFKEYCSKRIHCLPEESIPPTKDTKLCVFKIDEQWKTMNILEAKNVKSIICRSLRLKKTTLLLRSARNGCVELIFDIPKHVAAIVFPLSKDQIGALKEHGYRFVESRDHSSHHLPLLQKLTDLPDIEGDPPVDVLNDSPELWLQSSVLKEAIPCEEDPLYVSKAHKDLREKFTVLKDDNIHEKSRICLLHKLAKEHKERYQDTFEMYNVKGEEKELKIWHTEIVKLILHVNFLVKEPEIRQRLEQWDCQLQTLIQDDSKVDTEIRTGLFSFSTYTKLITTKGHLVCTWSDLYEQQLSNLNDICPANGQKFLQLWKDTYYKLQDVELKYYLQYDRVRKHQKVQARWLKISELQEAVDTKFEGLIKDEQQIELLLNSPSLQYENCKQFLYRREFNLEQLKTLLTEQREICIRLSKLNLQFECQGLKKLSESAKLLVDKIKTHITQCSTMAENHQRGLHRWMVQIELETEHHALQKKVEVLEQNLISEQRILQNLTDVLLLREKLEKKICEEMEVIRRNGIHSSLHDMLLKKLSEVHESSLHQQQHLKKILNKGQKKNSPYQTDAVSSQSADRHNNIVIGGAVGTGAGVGIVVGGGLGFIGLLGGPLAFATVPAGAALGSAVGAGLGYFTKRIFGEEKPDDKQQTSN